MYNKTKIIGNFSNGKDTGVIEVGHVCNYAKTVKAARFLDNDGFQIGSIITMEEEDFIKIEYLLKRYLNYLYCNNDTTIELFPDWNVINKDCNMLYFDNVTDLS